MKKLYKIFALLLLVVVLCGCYPKNATPTDDKTDDVPFEDFGMEVIELHLSEIEITEDGRYTSMEEVAAFIYTYHKLPQNYKVKKEFNKSDYTNENKLSVGGNVFYNREELLPIATGRTYTECDIDYTGGSRNSKRIVFSSDWLIFYTADHYESYSIVRVYDDRT